MNYIIIKSKKKYKIIEFNIEKGYKFTPKKELKIDKITIYDQNLTEDILNIKINTRFKKIAQLVFKITNDEDPESDDVLLVVGEISRLKGIILNKYDKYIATKTKKTMLNKIKLLETQLKKKLLTLSYDEKKEKTRSR